MPGGIPALTHDIAGNEIPKEILKKVPLLFMSIFTYPPENRGKVIKRLQQIKAVSAAEPPDPNFPRNFQTLGDWTDLGGGRIFRLIYSITPPPTNYNIYWHGAWRLNDLGKVEVVPVAETDVLLNHMLTDENKFAEAEITAYSFPEQVQPAVIGDGTIDITVAPGTDVTNLVATFTTSPNITSIQVDGADQFSGTTPNDFSTLVTYVVTAEDSFATKKWRVAVQLQAVNP